MSRLRRNRGGERGPKPFAGHKGRHGLARWISKFGLLSRTESERRVRDGRVTLNGSTVRDPERPCHPDVDTIRLDGRPLRPARKVYLAMNKPMGVITTARDPEGRPTVYDLLPPGARGVQAVGRLDTQTSGLLLFTNDTAFAARITMAGGAIEKVYRVRLQGSLGPEEARRFAAGVELDGKMTLPARCRILGPEGDGTLVECEIFEGRNRQVRRMWEKIGFPVLELARVRIGPLELGGLLPGKTRPLSEYERVLLEQKYPSL